MVFHGWSKASMMLYSALRAWASRRKARMTAACTSGPVSASLLL